MVKFWFAEENGFRAQAGSEMAVDGQRVNRWFRSCPFPLPHPLPSCPFSFPSLPSPLPSLPFPLPLLPLPPKWICCPKMVEFLGGVFGRSFWAEIFCPKTLPKNVARTFLRGSNPLPQSVPQNCPKIETLTFYHMFDFLGGPLKKLHEQNGARFGAGFYARCWVFGRSFWAELFCPRMLPENAARKHLIGSRPGSGFESSPGAGGVWKFEKFGMWSILKPGW